MEAALLKAWRVVTFLPEENILSQVRYSSVEQEVPLVFVSNEELGLTSERWIPLHETHTAGLSQGLKLCEWEDGPQFAAQYDWNQPFGTFIHVAMRPIIDSNGHARMFIIAFGDAGNFLHTESGYERAITNRKSRFMFRCSQ